MGRLSFVILEASMDRTLFQVLRHSLKTVQAKTEANTQRERGETRPWAVYDSALRHHAATFEHAYERSFHRVIPEEFSTMKTYIEQRFFEKKGNVVGMDIGGTGSKLFRDFPAGFFEKSFGVTLMDQRDDEVKKKDGARHHAVIEADAFSSKGQRMILGALYGKKVDVLFERMYGGLIDMKTDSHFLAAILERWYGLLSERGVMFVELPHLSSKDAVPVVRWLRGMERGKVPGVAVRYTAYGDADDGFLKIFVCLEKEVGAPEHLRESFSKNVSPVNIL